MRKDATRRMRVTAVIDNSEGDKRERGELADGMGERRWQI
jgi:hypothetical protein